MKVAFSISILIIFLFWACTQTDQKIDESSNTEQPTQTEKRTVEVPRFPSPAASVIQTIGRSTLQIDYSRPSVISIDGIDRTGKIWGKLVPYDFNFRPTMGGGKPRPWRAGANENTVIEFSHAAKVEGQPIEAGKYGLHIAVHENAGGRQCA